MTTTAPAAPYHIPADHRAAGAARAAIAALGPGDRAELRRMDPAAPDASAFYRLLVTTLEPALGASEHGLSSERQRGWGLVMHCLALQDAAAAELPLGLALAAADASELRVAKVLRATPEGLFDALPTVIRQLAAKGVAADARHVADLVHASGERAEQIRRRIARDYYRRVDAEARGAG